jgi:hypothetical protein
VHQLEPLCGQNLASGENPSQGSPALEHAYARGKAGPSSPNIPAMWDTLARSHGERHPVIRVPHRSTLTEAIPWCNDVLIPVRRYEGDVDVSIIPCIGQRLGYFDFDPTTSRFQVIGLT